MALELNGTTGASLVESGALPFLVGQVCFFAMDTVPDGFLKANGAEVSRSTYADLFSAIGTTFGAGDGSTTFELPDLRGEFPRGWDDGRGVDSGRSFGTAQLDQMQKITGESGPTNSVGASPDTYGIYVNSFTGALIAVTTGLNRNNDITNKSSNMVGTFGFDSSQSPNARTSSTTDGETRSRNIAMLACIKY